jgi:hypothetical protein
MTWDDGTAKNYAVPWTVVSKGNADQLLTARRK